MVDSALAPWRDASLVLLALETFVLVLVPLVILYFLNRGMHWVLTHARTVLRMVREKGVLAAHYAEVAATKAAWPFIVAQSTTAGIRAGAKALWRLLQEPGDVAGGAIGGRDGMTGGTH